MLLHVVGRRPIFVIQLLFCQSKKIIFSRRFPIACLVTFCDKTLILGKQAEKLDKYHSTLIWYDTQYQQMRERENQNQKTLNLGSNDQIKGHITCKSSGSNIVGLIKSVPVNQYSCQLFSFQKNRNNTFVRIMYIIYCLSSIHLVCS